MPSPDRGAHDRAELDKLMRKSGARGERKPSHSGGPAKEPKVGSPIALLASLLLPGLGQILAGRRSRGLWIVASAAAIALVAGWWARETDSMWPWLALLPFWLLQALEAARLASSPEAQAHTARLALLGMLPVYLVGWQATEIAPGLMVERYSRIQPFLKGLMQPDFIDPVVESTEAKLQIWTPCNPEEPSQLAELSADEPSIRVEPACAALGETLEVSGEGFPVDTEIELRWIGPTGDPIPLEPTTSDASGAFRSSLVAPLNSVPQRVRERSPDVPQDQGLEARVSVPTGGFDLSETLAVILENIGVTIALGFMATLIGSLLAIPLSLLGARNLMGGSPATRAVYGLVRGFMNVVRSIESLILAVVFVVWVGQGPFAGMLALTVHTVAAIGKLFSEAIESIDEGPIEAVRATGASWLQIVRYAVLPQILPPFTAFSVYRFDINIRMSTILGFVGGGGIGFILQQWIAKSEWNEVSTAVIVIAALLILLDQISATTRERIAEGRPIAKGIFRPVLALGLIAFAIWAWRETQVDLARLLRDRSKVVPITGQLLRPEVLESEVLTQTLEIPVAVPCGSGEVPNSVSEGDLVLELESGCFAEGDEIAVRVSGLSESAGTSARLRWLLPDGRRLGAGILDPEGAEVEAQVEVRRLVAEQAEALQAQPRLQLEAATPTGQRRASEPLRLTLANILESVLMALMATTFGAMLAFPLAFLGARNLMPRSLAGNGLYYSSRTFMNVSRAIEPLVLAAVFAAWVGVGSPFAGVLALIVVTMANLGKLFSEAVEDIDPGPLEAIRATGASRLQTIWHGAVPQIVPPFLAFGIYHWDINVRISTIVGFVGGGGIGFVLREWMNVTQWRWASVAILAIIIVVTLMDWISAKVRARLV